MPKRKVLFLSLLPLIASCSGADLGGVDFPFTNHENRPTLGRNGDNYGLTDNTAPYADLVKFIDFNQIADKLGHDEPVYLFLYQDNCSTCKQIHSRFAQFLLDSDIECYSLKSGTIQSNLSKLFETYPEMKETIKAATPTAYILYPDGTAEDTDLISNISMTSIYENLIKQKTNLSLVYSFSKFAPLKTFLNENKALVYTLDAEEGIANYREYIEAPYKASFVNKPLCLVDYASFNAEERLEARRLGIDEQNCVFLNKSGVISEKASLEEATNNEGLLVRYYSSVLS